MQKVLLAILFVHFFSVKTKWETLSNPKSHWSNKINRNYDLYKNRYARRIFRHAYTKIAAYNYARRIIMHSFIDNNSAY